MLFKHASCDCFKTGMHEFIHILKIGYLFFPRAKMSEGLSKEIASKKSCYHSPTPEMKLTPRATRSSTRRVRFSDDSGVSIVPFSPDLENTAGFAVKREKMVGMLLIWELH